MYRTVKSLYCTSKTNITLYGNYTRIKIKNLIKFQKSRKESDKLLNNEENISYKVHAFYWLCRYLHVINQINMSQKE